MMWLRSPRQRWWLLAVLWLLLLILGIGGFIQQAHDLGTSTSPLDNLYFTLQLAALDYKGSSSEINWRLQIARFVAPVIAASTIVQSASVVFREQFARFRARRARRHTVVCGLGPVGARLVGALIAEGRDVVAVEADPASPGIAAATDLGVPVIIGDPTEVSTLVAASVGRASQLVAITESDAVNAAIAAALGRVDRRAGMPPVRSAVHLTNADLAHLVRSTELGRSDQRHVEFFNLHERAAAALLSEHVVGEDSELTHLVVMGVGQFGRNIILAGSAAACRKWPRPTPRHARRPGRDGAVPCITHAASRCRERGRDRLRRPRSRSSDRRSGRTVRRRDAQFAAAARGRRVRGRVTRMVGGVVRSQSDGGRRTGRDTHRVGRGTDRIARGTRQTVRSGGGCTRAHARHVPLPRSGVLGGSDRGRRA